jgi:hypothetical protein
MMHSSHPFRSALLACAAVLLPLASANAAEPIRIVFQNGRAVALSSVSLQGTNLTVNVSAEGFVQGQTFPLESADHVFGDKPAEINQGIALLLSDKPGDALKLLEPVVASQRVTASIPGTFWLEAARGALIAYALSGDAGKCADIGKEISDATPQQGTDSFVLLGKALTLPPSTKVDEKDTALRDLTTDNLPADVCAYASFYRGNLLKTAKRDKDALEAYLAVPCLFPTGGLVVNGMAELRASEFLAAMDRREEAVALLKSCISHTTGTLVATEANKRLESLK